MPNLRGDEAKHTVETLAWMAVSYTMLMSIAMASAIAFKNTREDSKDLLSVGESGVRTDGFFARLKKKLESMVKVKKGLTVDSGAADHVMPLGWIAWIIVVASLGSLRGLHYVSASGNRLPNMGEQKVRFLTKDGVWATLLFQIAGINKPLVSVSKLIDEGWRVVFDDEGSYLLHKITKKKIMMDRTRGVFTIEAYIEPESEAPVFSRRA